MSKIVLTEEDVTNTPATGKSNLYVKTDGSLAVRDDTGTETIALSSGAIGTTIQAYDAGLAYLDGLNFTNESTFKQGVNLEIGVDVQAYDADTAKLDVVQTWTAEQTFAEIKETVYNMTGTVIDPANGTIQYKTLSGNTTLTESLADGQSVTLMINDGTAYTVTWPTTTWVGGSAPTLPTSGYAVIVLWQVSGTLYGNHVGDA